MIRGVLGVVATVLLVLSLFYGVQAATQVHTGLVSVNVHEPLSPLKLALDDTVFLVENDTSLSLNAYAGDRLAMRILLDNHANQPIGVSIRFATPQENATWITLSYVGEGEFTSQATNEWTLDAEVPEDVENYLMGTLTLSINQSAPTPAKILLAITIYR